MLNNEGGVITITDYSNSELFASAHALYETEVSLSQHYETLRATLTAGNIAIVGYVAGLSERPSINAQYFLIALGVVAGVLALRLSHAHLFHFNLSSKMRSIIALHHPKTNEKLIIVRKSWAKSTWGWGWLGHGALWVAINTLVPFAFAFLGGGVDLFWGH